MGHTQLMVHVHNVAAVQPTRKTLWHEDGTSFQTIEFEAFDPKGQTLGYVTFFVAEGREAIDLRTIKVVPEPQPARAA
jgi:hypothetical protein